MTAAERKAHIRWSIEQNPSTIMIRRTRKVRSGGGFQEEHSDIGPVTVRIFTTSSSAPKQVSTVAGSKQTDTRYSMLADDKADIRKDTMTTDRFEANGQMFEIMNVFPQVVRGELVGYQADLERVM